MHTIGQYKYKKAGGSDRTEAMLWRTCLRNGATSRKVADSIPVVIIGHNPSGRIMALGWTQPLTDMSTRNISWG